MRGRFVIFLILTFLLSNTYAGSSKPRMEDVAGKLSCLCGTCPHLVVTQCGCSAADKIKVEVQKKIDAGMTESQILDSFVAQYGATVLSAPPKKGFDLAAWLFPFIAFFFGAAVLFTYLKRQRSEQGNGAGESQQAMRSETEDQHYREELEKELSKRQ